MKKGVLLVIVLFSLISFVYAGNVSVWQGQYFKGTEFQKGTFDFNFTVYDAQIGGGPCYSSVANLTTGNFGEWKTEQQGVGAGCNNASRDYFLEILINNESQGDRRRLTIFDFLRKDANSQMTGTASIVNNIRGYLLWSLNWPEELKAQMVSFFRFNPLYVSEFYAYFYPYIIGLITVLLVFTSWIILSGFKKVPKYSFAASAWFTVSLLPVLFFPKHSFP